MRIRRVSRSPLRFATRRQIAALRALAHAQNDWLDRLGTPRQEHHITEPHEVRATSGFGDLWALFIAENRAWNRAIRTFSPERLQEAAERHGRFTESRAEREVRELRERVASAESRLAALEGVAA